MYELTTEQFYKLKVKILMRKYGLFYVEYKKHNHDDRCLVPGIIDMLVESCKAMETMDNVSVQVAYNRYFDEREIICEEIVSRFEGMSYDDFEWKRKED